MNIAHIVALFCFVLAGLSSLFGWDLTTSTLVLAENRALATRPVTAPQIGVHVVVGVAERAMGLRHVHTTRAAGVAQILFGSNRPQMIRPNAQRVTTDVVDLQPRRDRTQENKVREDVDVIEAPLVTDVSIASAMRLAASSPLPDPAGRREECPVSETFPDRSMYPSHDSFSQELKWVTR
jgi:hypothetical protein